VVFLDAKEKALFFDCCVLGSANLSMVLIAIDVAVRLRTVNDVAMTMRRMKKVLKGEGVLVYRKMARTSRNG
jgi:hypothetical protein